MTEHLCRACMTYREVLGEDTMPRDKWWHCLRCRQMFQRAKTNRAMTYSHIQKKSYSNPRTLDYWSKIL